MAYRNDELSDLTAPATTRAAVGTVSKSGNALADGVLSGYAWAGSSIEYAFPTKKGSYQYSGERDQKFSPVNEKIRDAVRETLDKNYGNSGNDGFSVEGFTNLKISKGNDAKSELRFAESAAADPTAYAYYPSSGDWGGDVWFGKARVYDKPDAGNYAYQTVIHETGHALGLKHGHKAQPGEINTVLKGKYDSLEYSVMTYHSYAGQKGETGYVNEAFGYPQSFMMADIRALQHMYGADFSTNGGDTVYRWSPKTGKTMVDGEVGINPGANRIFATIWDGGGTDTYDLSAYTKGVSIDLRPGQSSTFSKNQLADLDYRSNGRDASGNIYNALLYRGDERSLIENAIGGKGNDMFRGNAADNVFTGKGGADTFFFRSGGGDDTIRDFSGSDKINLAGMGLKFSDIKELGSNIGNHFVIDFGDGDSLTLRNVARADLNGSDFMFG